MLSHDIDEIEQFLPNSELNENCKDEDNVAEADQNDSSELIEEEPKDCVIEIGKISLDFCDGNESCPSEPISYFTVSAKERLLLIYAENFRRKFRDLHMHRNPLVLAVPNECGIQKFVSTTIRPTIFLYPELIDCWDGPAQFVADFITYEPLDNPVVMVSTYLLFVFFFQFYSI